MSRCAAARMGARLNTDRKDPGDLPGDAGSGLRRQRCGAAADTRSTPSLRDGRSKRTGRFRHRDEQLYDTTHSYSGKRRGYSFIAGRGIHPGTAYPLATDEGMGGRGTTCLDPSLAPHRLFSTCLVLQRTLLIVQSCVPKELPSREGNAPGRTRMKAPTDVRAARR